MYLIDTAGTQNKLLQNKVSLSPFSFCWDLPRPLEWIALVRCHETLVVHDDLAGYRINPRFYNTETLMLGVKQLCDQELHHPLRGQVRKLVSGPCQIGRLIVQFSIITLEVDRRQGNHKHASGWKLLPSWTSNPSAILVRYSSAHLMRAGFLWVGHSDSRAEPA